MENLLSKFQRKFKSLKNNEKIAAVIILVIFIGMFFFISGISIGEVFHNLTQ